MMGNFICTNAEEEDVNFLFVVQILSSDHRIHLSANHSCISKIYLAHVPKYGTVFIS